MTASTNGKPSFSVTGKEQDQGIVSLTKLHNRPIAFRRTPPIFIDRLRGVPMSEGKQLIDTLKAELRRRGFTYYDLVTVLDLSHASVKRLFAEHNFTLERVELICRFLGMGMAELFSIMEKKQNKLARL